MSGAAPILIVGALRAETLPILQALAHRRRHRGLWAGHLGGPPLLVTTCGVGPRRAAAHTRAVLAQHRPRAVLSVGTCGALVDGLRVGDIVHDAHGWATLEGLRPARIHTVDRAVWSPARRAALAAAGHEVVEMEAAAVRTAAEAAGLPFGALKVVSDRAGAGGRAPDGRPGPLDIARFQLRALRLSRRRLVPVLAGLQGPLSPGAGPAAPGGAG